MHANVSVQEPDERRGVSVDYGILKDSYLHPILDCSAFPLRDPRSSAGSQR